MIYQKKADGSWISCGEFLGTVGDQYLDGSLTIPSSKQFIAGDLNSPNWAGLYARRHIGGKQLEARYGVGTLDGVGYAQVGLHELTQDGTNPSINTLMINEKNLMTTYPVDLGRKDLPFGGAYFGNKIELMDRAKIFTNSGGYAYVEFADGGTKELLAQLGKYQYNTDNFRLIAMKGNLTLESYTGNTNIEAPKGNTRLGATAVTDALIGSTMYGVRLSLKGPNWNFAPYGNVTIELGNTTDRFGTLYTKTAPNVSSDKSLKSNIKYVNDNVNTLNTQEVITKEDSYNFIAQDLKIAEYEMLEDKEKNNHIGFIAQDLENTKVGEKILTKNTDGTLAYNSGNYTNVLALALQKSIEEIENLKQEIAILKNN